MEIPPSPRGIPIAWKGHYYARAGESLTPLGLGKLDEIRRQTIGHDWTAAVVPEAGLDDLDDEAVNELLWDKLSDALTEDQKAHKITNLLTKMRRAGQIRNEGSRTKPSWR